MRRLYWFAAFLVIYELATYLSNDMIMPGMIQVIHQFHAPQAAVAWSLGFYILGNCAVLLFVGALAEHYGNRKVMLIGNFLFMVFTILITFSHSIHEFMIYRFLAGGGLAVIAVGYGLIHEHFNDKDSVKLITLMGNVSVLAPLLGPMFGSIIVSYVSWHFIFILTALFSLVSLCGLFRYIPKETEKKTEVNVMSLVKKYQDILKDPQFLQGTLCVTFSAMPILLWIGQAPNLVLYHLHQNYTHFALYQLISIGGLVVAGALMQWAAGRFAIASVIQVGMWIILAGLTLACVLGGHNIWWLSSGEGIYSLGLGISNGCLFRLIMSDKKFSTGLLSSLLIFIQMLLFFIGIGLTNKIFAHYEYSLQSFAFTSLVFGCIVFLLTKRYLVFYQTREWE